MIQENLLQKDESKEEQVDQHHDQNSSKFATFVSAMIIGIVMLIVLIHIGFFHTYIKFFPKFEDVVVGNRGLVHFDAVKHFHGMMMMGWVFMLLLQPILIRSRKMKLHRQVGKLSYALAPLVLLSLFLINQHNYHHTLARAGESQAIARISLTFPGLVFFGILYFLAIRYRHHPPLHMRFMCSTAFLLIGPALDRALIFVLHLPGPAFDIGSIIQLLIIGAVTIIDSLKIKRLSPFALVFALEVLHTILWHSRQGDFWQSVGGIIAKLY